MVLHQLLMEGEQVANQIQLRYDTTAAWAAEDPIPLVAEVCVDIDLNMFKLGDGVSNYSDLPWASMDLDDPALATKITTVGAGAFAAIAIEADVASLLSRVDTIEESGVVKTGATPFTLTSNANVFTTLGTGADQAGSYAMPAGALEVGDTLIMSAICDVINTSGGSVVFDVQFIVGSFRLTGTPITAGFSIASVATIRRPYHIWVEITAKDATHFHVAAGFQLGSTKAAADEAALFNGTTTAFDSIDAVANAAINIANAMTFALQGKIRTNTAAAELKVIKANWAISKGV